MSVSEQGYAATTVDDVIQRARMSRRTFYEIFENRVDCFLAAYDRARDDALAAIGYPRGGPEPWIEQVAGTLGRMLEYLATSPHFATLLVVEPTSVGPSGLARHERTMRELAARLARCHPGRTSADLRLQCEASVGAVHRVVQARIVDGRAGELPKLTPQLTAVVEVLLPKHTD